MIRFTDDIVAIVESERNIKSAVDELNEILKTMEIKLNGTKTKS